MPDDCRQPTMMVEDLPMELWEVNIDLGASYVGLNCADLNTILNNHVDLNEQLQVNSEKHLPTTNVDLDNEMELDAELVLAYILNGDTLPELYLSVDERMEFGNWAA